MNDTSELTYPRELLDDVLRDLDTHGWGVNDPERLLSVDERTFLNDVVDAARRDAAGAEVIAVSASTDCDKLSQWVHYAGASGVAIGFASSQVMVHSEYSGDSTSAPWPKAGWGWMRLQYVRAEQEQALRDVLRGVVEAAADHGAGTRQARIDHQVWALLTSLQRVKHPAYSEESEVRHFAPVLGGEVLRFRARGHDVVAYAPLVVQSSFAGGQYGRKQLAIRAVVCGPALSSGNMREIQILLSAHGLPEAAVSKSTIPYIPRVTGS